MKRRRSSLAAVAVFLCAGGVVPVSAGSDTVAEIKRLSQAFSDASASGNAAVFKRLLDDRVIFINENGDQATKRDLVDGAGPPPRGMSNKLVQSDVQVQIHGNVAVTAFTDNSTVRFNGQTTKAAYRSIEVWLREAAGWKMVSSQTLALQNDPPAVTLPGAVLDEYAGTYTAGPGYTVVIVHAGEHLTASLNGAKPLVYQAELKDVFFVAGQPRVRRIFQRDATGAITGYVGRREGHDTVVERMTDTAR